MATKDKGLEKSLSKTLVDDIINQGTATINAVVGQQQTTIAAVTAHTDLEIARVGNATQAKKVELETKKDEMLIDINTQGGNAVTQAIATINSHTDNKKIDLDNHEQAKEVQMNELYSNLEAELRRLITEAIMDRGVVINGADWHNLRDGNYYVADLMGSGYVNQPQLDADENRGIVLVSTSGRGAYKIIRYYSIAKKMHFMIKANNTWSEWSTVSEGGGLKYEYTQPNHGFTFTAVQLDGNTNTWVAADKTTGADGVAVRIDNNRFELAINGSQPIPSSVRDSEGNILVADEFYFLSNSQVGGFDKFKPIELFQPLFRTYIDEAGVMYAEIDIDTPVDLIPRVLVDEVESLDIATVNSTIRKENTIVELQRSNRYKIGEVVEVLGYYSAGDGANHKRVIAQADDGSGVRLGNGLWANIVHNGEVNVSWFGAKGDGVTDDTLPIQKAINTSNVAVLSKKYKISTLEIQSGQSLVGNSLEGYLKPSLIHFGNREAITVVNTYESVSIKNICFRGGTENIYAIKALGRVNLEDVTCLNYKGNGVYFGGNSWSSRVNLFDYKGFAEGSEQISPLKNNIGVEIDLLGGNIIIDNSSIVLAVQGILVQRCDQLTIRDSNVSENHVNYFPSATTTPSSITINNAVNTNITDCYIENFDNGILLNGSDIVSIRDCFINGMSVGSYGIKSNGCKKLIIDSTKTILNYSRARHIAVDINTELMIINSEYDKDKIDILSNNYIVIDNTGISGNYKLSGATENVYNWLELHKTSTGGSYQISKSITNATFTNYGLDNDNTAQYLLPTNAIVGTTYCFAKEKNWKQSVLKIISAEGNILPTNSNSIDLPYNKYQSVVIKKIKESWIIVSEKIQTDTLTSLNTPYYTEKMKSEGVYNDFISYMDSKTEYDNYARNQDVVDGVSNLMVIEEPKPSPALIKFKEKYLG